MYKKGDIVAYGLNGICEITEISTLNIRGIPQNREYYTLYIRINGETVYVPVDSLASNIRRIITKEEAENLVSKIPIIEPLKGINERTIETTYREYLYKFDYEEWISLIKFIYNRKEKRLKLGKKATAIDEKYMKKAEDILYQELALALEIPIEQVLDYITKKVKNNNNL